MLRLRVDVHYSRKPKESRNYYPAKMCVLLHGQGGPSDALEVN